MFRNFFVDFMQILEIPLDKKNVLAEFCESFFLFTEIFFKFLMKLYNRNFLTLLKFLRGFWINNPSLRLRIKLWTILWFSFWNFFQFKFLIASGKARLILPAKHLFMRVHAVTYVWNLNSFYKIVRDFIS